MPGPAKAKAEAQAEGSESENKRKQRNQNNRQQKWGKNYENLAEITEIVGSLYFENILGELAKYFVILINFSQAHITLEKGIKGK